MTRSDDVLHTIIIILLFFSLIHLVFIWYTLMNTYTGDVAEFGPDCEGVEKGNTVLYNKFGIGCTDIEMGGDSYIVIKECDLIGTFPGSGATADDIPKLSPLVRRGSST